MKQKGSRALYHNIRKGKNEAKKKGKSAEDKVFDRTANSAAMHFPSLHCFVFMLPPSR